MIVLLLLCEYTRQRERERGVFVCISVEEWERKILVESSKKTRRKSNGDKHEVTRQLTMGNRLK